MAFQTRSGSNRFTGSAYEYYRNPSFNSNYVFNEINHQRKNEVKLNQFGARARRADRDSRASTTATTRRSSSSHYEQIRFPNSFTRTRTVFNPRVADGWFRYQFGSEVREVNVLQLGGRQRPDLRERPDDDEAVRADRRGDEDDRHAHAAERSAVRQLRVAEPVGAVRAPADLPPRLQPRRTITG